MYIMEEEPKFCFIAQQQKQNKKTNCIKIMKKNYTNKYQHTYYNCNYCLSMPVMLAPDLV